MRDQQSGKQRNIPLSIKAEQIRHQHARKHQKRRSKQTDDRRHGHLAANHPVDGLQIAPEGGLINRFPLLGQQHGVAAEAERIIAVTMRQKGKQQGEKPACLISGSVL